MAVSLVSVYMIVVCLISVMYGILVVGKCHGDPAYVKLAEQANFFLECLQEHVWG